MAARRRVRGRGRRRVGGGRVVGVVDLSTEVGVVEPADRRVVEPRVRIGGRAGAGIRAGRRARAWVRSGDAGGTRVVPDVAALVQASGRCVVDSGVSGGAGGWDKGLRAGGNDAHRAPPPGWWRAGDIDAYGPAHRGC